MNTNNDVWSKVKSGDRIKICVDGVEHVVRVTQFIIRKGIKELYLYENSKKIGFCKTDNSDDIELLHIFD